MIFLKKNAKKFAKYTYMLCKAEFNVVAVVWLNILV